jgi:hypothetical protein
MLQELRGPLGEKLMGPADFARAAPPSPEAKYKILIVFVFF